ncbi:unnamed protein product [Knipowitschia caucasica]
MGHFFSLCHLPSLLLLSNERFSLLQRNGVSYKAAESEGRGERGMKRKAEQEQSGSAETPLSSVTHNQEVCQECKEWPPSTIRRKFPGTDQTELTITRAN